MRITFDGDGLTVGSSPEDCPWCAEMHAAFGAFLAKWMPGRCANDSEPREGNVASVNPAIMEALVTVVLSVVEIRGAPLYDDMERLFARLVDLRAARVSLSPETVRAGEMGRMVEHTIRRLLKNTGAEEAPSAVSAPEHQRVH